MQTGNHAYRITEVLGRGGFGTVYRAQLTDGQGFVKEVAIKLLSDSDPPPEVLQRFRDEARILGLVRDRAVVQVDPPVKLGSRWAVVMEYVEGVSLARLSKSFGAIPPTVALAIIAEIARSLDRLWHQMGPDGQPLRLCHRDIKPANIQLTPDGIVKLLDFGIAKASFSGREAKTTSMLHGTHGYIAPERFLGEEGITTDVFSLGIVLHVLLYGHAPDSKLEPLAAKKNSNLGIATRLAQRMYTLDPSERPFPRDVENEALTMIREMRGPDLRSWARPVIPRVVKRPADDLVGTVLSTAVLRKAPPSNLIARSFLGLSTLLLGVVVGVTLIIVLGVGWMVLRPAENTRLPTSASFPVPAPLQRGVMPAEPAEEEADEPNIAEEPEAAEQPEASVEPKVAAEPAPAVAHVKPVATRAPSQAFAPPAPKKPVATPVAPPPEPVADAVDPEPVAPTWPVTFVSLPPDATIYIDGVKVGTTPAPGVAISKGRHTLRFVRGEQQIEQSITVGKRAPKRYVWRVEQGKVAAAY